MEQAQDKQETWRGTPVANGQRQGSYPLGMRVGCAAAAEQENRATSCRWYLRNLGDSVAVARWKVCFQK